MKQILFINDQGIDYIEDGRTHFISFERCYNNWYNREMSRTDVDFDRDWFQRISEDFRQVGVKDFFASPPYIEFHVEPTVHFEFSGEDDYMPVVRALIEAGYALYDLG